ncbi:B12-binding domain-containing radical SAM protein [Myxococcota bacterium]|nr:B12-binding domain-containing radical SAM protein [Myxococcota bacterium]
MRVLLVNPNSLAQRRIGTVWKYAVAVPPTGLAYIASVLRQDGFEVGIVDQYARRWDNERLLAEVEAWRPDVVGFSCLTFAMESVEDAVGMLRARLPGAHVVLGNAHATYFARELVAAGVADTVVRGEGELATLDLCRALREGRDLHGIPGLTFRDGDRIAHAPDRPVLEDLDQLPFPAWDLLVDESYQAEPLGFRVLEGKAFTIQASRGCPYACSFCSQDIIYPKLRKRDMRRVVEEMDWAHRTWGVRVFGFIDAIFPFGRKQLDALATEMRARGLHEKVTWFTETRVDLVDPELLKEAYSVGLRFVQLGIESGDDEVLGLMQKKAAARQALDAVRWCREAGILTFGLFVIGMPGETREQVERTIRFARAVDCDMAKFNICVPYPGTALWEEHRDRLAGQPTWKYSGWFDPTLNDTEHLLSGASLPASELVRLQRRGMMEFYLRPRTIARYLGGDLIPRRRLLKGGAALLDGYRSAIWNGHLRPRIRRSLGRDPAPA